MQHKPDNHTFQSRQEPERQQQGHRQPNHQVHGNRRLELAFGQKNQRHDDMPDDNHRQVGWKIVGADVTEFLATGVTVVRGLKVLPKKLRAATAGTSLTETAPKKGAEAGNRKVGIYGRVPNRSQTPSSRNCSYPVGRPHLFRLHSQFCSPGDGITNDGAQLCHCCGLILLVCYHGNFRKGTRGGAR